MVTVRTVYSTFALAALLSAGAAVAGGGARPARHPVETNPRTGMAVPSFDQLVRAVRQRDRGATERIVARIGAGRLIQGLAQPDRRVVLAVLSAAPDSRGALLLTNAVADLTSSGDPAVASAAAHALGRLLEGGTPADFELWEVPPDVVAHACAALQGLALRGLVVVPVRMAALVALADAASTCGDTDGLLPLLRDVDPGLRRAAAQVVRARSPVAAGALREAIRDPDPLVGTAAVAALCRRERGAPGGAAAPSDVSTAAAASAAAEAARILILKPSTPVDDAVDMLACLLGAGTLTDQKIEDLIRRGPPSPLRDQLIPLSEPAAPAKSP